MSVLLHNHTKISRCTVVVLCTFISTEQITNNNLTSLINNLTTIYIIWIIHFVIETFGFSLWKSVWTVPEPPELITWHYLYWSGCLVSPMAGGGWIKTWGIHCGTKTCILSKKRTSSERVSLISHCKRKRWQPKTVVTHLGSGTRCRNN